MAQVVGIRFKNTGKTYYFTADGFVTRLNQKVIVETAKGLECGEIVLEKKQVDESELATPLKPIVRIATERDFANIEQNKQKEKAAYPICEEKIAKHKLDMNLVNIEYAFDGSKILFYFTSEGRVDFRELVKDLAGVFKTRIELRQIGVRDESKMLGGLGICGRPFCCSSFLGDFHPVSIKMAKDQSLSLNPAKISGSCGRLMCCLKYEQEAYEDLLKRTPKYNAYVDTPEGKGYVCDVSLLTGMLKVRLDSNPDAAPHIFTREMVKIIKNGSDRRRGSKPDNSKGAKTDA